MKAVFTTTGHVPWSRVARDYRAALVPLGAVLAINLIALVAVVLPMSGRVAANEERAVTAERQRMAAEAELKRSQTLQEAQTQATQDLQTFYAEVLPANVAAARRMLFLGLRQKAEKHGIRYESGDTDEEEIRDSSLLRMTMTVRLGGEYDDIRGFIHDLETSPEFIIIDNVSLAAQAADAGLAVTLEVSTYYRAPKPLAARTGGNAR